MIIDWRTVTVTALIIAACGAFGVSSPAAAMRRAEAIATCNSFADHHATKANREEYTAKCLGNLTIDEEQPSPPSRADGNSGNSTVWWLIVLGAAVYLLPTIVAEFRHKRNATSIAALNVLLGWTFVGWVIALVWALMHEPARQPA